VYKTLDQWPSSLFALPGWKYDRTLSFGLYQKVLTLSFVQTSLQVTARNTCDENHMMFASSKLITSSNNLILYFCLESNQSPHECKWVHIQITFWNLLISRIPMTLTIQSVGRFACLLCIVRIIGIFFFHTCLGLQELRGQHSILPAWNVWKELGWSVRVLGFRVWGWRRRVGTWGRWEKDIGPHFTNWEEKTQLDYLFICLFIFCPSSKL